MREPNTWKKQVQPCKSKKGYKDGLLKSVTMHFLCMIFVDISAVLKLVLFVMCSHTLRPPTEYMQLISLEINLPNFKVCRNRCGLTRHVKPQNFNVPSNNQSKQEFF